MRFVFTPPAEEAAGLLSLPWGEPLESWQDDRLVEIRQRGISRHVVRFVVDDGVLYALKELGERFARREYHLLRTLAELSIPAVEVVGVAVDRAPGADAILVTKFLTYATTYRAIFSRPRGGQPTGRLLDALVELLVRLHLSGFFWGDCSLSNTLFRYDAGTLEAYLVDAETSEQHPALSTGQRDWDLELTVERVYGELLDLQAGELLPDDVDPLEIAEQLQGRYQALWEELTREEILRPDEQRYRIAARLRLAQPARLRRRGGGAGQHASRQPAAGKDPRRRDRPAQPAAVLAHRYGRRRESGPSAAERHRLLPGLPGAEGRPPGLGIRGREPLAGGGLRAGRGGDPGRPARTAGAHRDLSRDPRAPLVHVGGSWPGRRDHGRGPLLLQAHPAEAPEPMETTTIAAAPNGAAAQPLEAEISSE